MAHLIFFNANITCMEWILGRVGDEGLGENHLVVVYIPFKTDCYTHVHNIWAPQKHTINTMEYADVNELHVYFLYLGYIGVHESTLHYTVPKGCLNTTDSVVVLIPYTKYDAT